MNNFIIFMKITILLKNKKQNLSELIFQITGSFFASGIGLFFDILTLTFLVEYFFLHYLLAASFGFLIGLIINYLISIFYVFNTRKVQNKSLEFIIFGLIGLIGLLILQTGMFIFVEYFLYSYLIAKLLTTGFVFLWNFSARKYFLF